MTTAEPSAPLRTGWEDDTPSSDSLSARRAARHGRSDHRLGGGRGGPGAARPGHGSGRRAVAVPVPQRCDRVRGRRPGHRAGDRRLLPRRAPVPARHPASGPPGATAPEPGGSGRGSRLPARAPGCTRPSRRIGHCHRRRGPRRRRARHLGPGARRGVPRPALTGPGRAAGRPGPVLAGLGGRRTRRDRAVVRRARRRRRRGGGHAARTPAPRRRGRPDLGGDARRPGPARGTDRQRRRCRRLPRDGLPARHTLDAVCGAAPDAAPPARRGARRGCRGSRRPRPRCRRRRSGRAARPHPA